MDLWIGHVTYGNDAKRWLKASGHYLDNPPPGCLFAIGVRALRPVLFADLPVADGPLLGLCLVGRPVAPGLPQDHSIGEITRMILLPGLPYGTASVVLRAAAAHGQRRGMLSLIAYHDRTRHKGCIYRKAGFRKDGTTTPSPNSIGWASRPRPNSAHAGDTPKRRWRLDLARPAEPA